MGALIRRGRNDRDVNGRLVCPPFFIDNADINRARNMYGAGSERAVLFICMYMYMYVMFVINRITSKCKYTCAVHFKRRFYRLTAFSRCSNEICVAIRVYDITSRYCFYIIYPYGIRRTTTCALDECHVTAASFRSVIKSFRYKSSRLNSL